MSIILFVTFLYNYFKYRHFEILEVTSFQIMKSAKHAGSLVRYRIKVLAKRPVSQLVFDELWVEDRLHHIKIIKIINQRSLDKAGTRQIVFIDSEPDIRYPSVPLPWAEKSKMLLGYLIGKKRKYFEIKEFFTCHPQLAVA